MFKNLHNKEHDDGEVQELLVVPLVLVGVEGREQREDGVEQAAAARRGVDGYGLDLGHDTRRADRERRRGCDGLCVTEVEVGR